MGVIEGNRPCSHNDKETMKKGQDDAIKKWIAAQMDGKSCVVVLIGSNTAGRKWINYEIVRGWNDGKGIVGVYVHNLLDSDKKQSPRGANPFATIKYGDAGRMLSSIVRAYDPPHTASKEVYNYICRNLAAWADEAITIRSNSVPGHSQ